MSDPYPADPYPGDPQAADPHAWARSWLPADDDPARPLMTMASLDLDGAPTGRTLLLSGVTGSGFTFHCDGRSAKAAEIAADPRVCLVVAFPERAQQIVVQGVATAQPETESHAAWRHRSPYLRLLAWLNDTELADLSLVERSRRWTEGLTRWPEGPPDPPDTWRGFDVTPYRYVFWEGGPDLASHRTEFRRSGDAWSVRYLPG